MKKILLLISILMTGLYSSGQVWNTQVNYENTEILNIRSSLIETMDGNILFIYNRFDDPALLNNKFTYALAKYNTLGELIWEKIYDHSEHLNIEPPSGLNARALTEMPNGNLVVVGSIRSTGESYLYYTNSLGDSLLYQTYPNLSLRQFVPFDENHVVAFATIFENGVNNPIIGKININSGAVVEQHSIPNNIPNSNIVLSPFEENYFMFTEPDDSFELYRISLDGNIETENTVVYPEGFGIGGGWGVSTNLALNGDGFLMFNEAVLAVKEDLSINFSIPFNNENLLASSFPEEHINLFILPTSDEGCLLSGTFNFPAGNYFDEQIYMIKLNENGEEEWNNLYGHWVFDSHAAPALLEVEDGYVFIRHNYLTGSIYMSKIRKDGSLDPSSLNELSEINVMNIYPNPAKDRIHLSYSGSESIAMLHIYTMDGRLIRTESGFNFNQNHVDINNLTQGLYFVRGSNQDGRNVLIGRFTKL